MGVRREDENGEDAKFLKTVFGGIGLITAWMFVLGWTYLQTYYTYFGVNINSLNFPVYHYLAFFFAQFVSFGLRGLSLGLLLLVAFGLAWAGTSAKGRLVAFLVSVGYLTVFWVGFVVARHDAIDTALEDMGPRSRRPIISIQFKEPKPFTYAAVEDTLSSGNLRLLVENNDQIYVFDPVDATTPEVRVQVVAVSRSDVYVSMRTVRAK